MAKPDLTSLFRIRRSPTSQFMATPGQTSFRRILLFRILLISVPVLLMGQYIIYRKAASSLQETARQTLPDSAERKAKQIRESIQALQSNLISASQTSILQSGSPELAQQFLNQLAQKLPTQIQCVQLTDLQANQIVASTCGNQAIALLSNPTWPQTLEQSILDSSSVRVESLLPRPSSIPTGTSQTPVANQVPLLFSAPVYDGDRALRYALSLQTVLNQPTYDQPGSLSGSTVVIDQDGIILQHPRAEQVGQNIHQQKNAERLKIIVNKATFGAKDFLHLSLPLERDTAEVVAGYTAIPSPITSKPNQKWTILAITRRDNALYNLTEIFQFLLLLTLGLIAASTAVSIFLARDLARPLEKLRDYAVNVQSYHSKDRIPKGFKIRELHQLAEAIKDMVERLKAWAQELETAWKEAQAANQLKSEFLANTSHELRTPLNAIIGCIRLVKDGCCDDREEELDFLQRADDAAIHLLNIINDILDLSKIESGTLSVVMERVNLQLLLKEVIDLQVVHINQKGLELHYFPSPNPTILQADPAKLKQVLINVVGNAIKFTDEGSISIATLVQTLPAKDPHSATPVVKVTVQDTGIGIAPEEQPKLFRPFVMADGTRTRKHGGTGLGLAISRKLIEMMNGSITLHSAGLGKGTTIEITLPLIEASALVSNNTEGLRDSTETSAMTNGAALNGYNGHLLSEVAQVDPALSAEELAAE